MFGPLLPLLSDGEASLGAMLQQAADRHVARIWVDALNPRPRVWPAVAALLRAEFPDLVEPYRRILFDAPARAAYLAEVRARIARVAQRLSLSGRVAACM